MLLLVPTGRACDIRLGGLLARLRHGAINLAFAVDRTKNAPALDEADLEDARDSLEGDSEAYRRLVERHQAYVGQILWRFSRDRQVHEELVQDVFVEAYLNLNSYREEAPFAHWLARIATRVGYRYWKQTKRQRRRENFSFKDWDQLLAEPSERMDPSQAAALVHELLAQLPPRDRLVLTLRYLQELDVAEAARRTGWSKTMVKVQTWRALKKLQKIAARAGKEISLS